MLGVTVALFGLMGGRITPLNEWNHNRHFVLACRNGDVRGLVKIIRETPAKEIDMNAGLGAAAARNHIHAMKTLLEYGATDIGTALVFAARYNHAQSVRWLTSPERGALAERILDDDLRVAQEAACMTAAVETEWLLVQIQRDRALQARREADDGDAFDLF
jgi:hypothetical protein